MADVSQLYGKHPGADIYVVGTGTSMRVFPMEFLADKITIGLNRAWQLLPVQYSISMVPHLNFPEFLSEPDRENTVWITKHDKYESHASAEQLARAERDYYFFRTKGRTSYTLRDEPSEAGRVLDWVKQPTEDFLYLWTSISQTAVNLAANLGARNIILVGCDNAALAENHHAHVQHTLWKGVDPEVRYLQYYEGLAEIRAVLRTRGVNLLSMNSFLKLDDPEMDFRRICTELDKEQYVPNEDIYRPATLRQDNVRFLRLARTTLRLNLQFLSRALGRRLPWRSAGAEAVGEGDRSRPPNE